MPDALKLRIVGLCILAAFPLFGGGQALLGGNLHWVGLFMCLGNSVAVITVGFLMRSLIARTAPRIGSIYFVARIAEGVLLGVSTLAIEGTIWGLTFTSEVFYLLAMIGLGLGSLPMCLWLIRSTLVPAMLGAAGFAGYLCLVAAMIAQAYGLATASMLLLLPGAVFEVIFGLILVLHRRKRLAH